MSHCRASAGWVSRLVAAAAWAVVAGSAATGQIQERELGEVDILTIAALPPQDGGLDRGLWRGVAADEALRLMRLSPGETHSIAAAAIVARTLRSGGDAPEGAENQRDLGLARLSALFEAGHTDTVARILSGATGVLSDGDYAQLAARARFAAGDARGACLLVRRIEAPREQGFWARARAACFALAGEAPAAELTLSVARDLGAERVDEAFDAWITRAVGAGGAPAPPRDAIELALAVHAGGPLSAEAGAAVSLPAAVGLALDGRAPIGARLTAARRAAVNGAITADAYGEVMRATPSPDSTGASAALIAASGDAQGPAVAALLHQAVLAARDRETPADLARAVAAALDHADGARDFIVAARLYRAELNSLPTSRDVLAYAPVLAQAAAVAGDVAVARRLLEAHAAPPGEPTALVAVDPEQELVRLEPADSAALAVLIALADGAASGAELQAAALARLNAALALGPDEQASAERDALLLLALGADNTPALRAASEAAAAAAAPLPPAARGALTAMEAASDAQALAATTLNAARMLHAAEPGHPVAAARAARALWRAGLDAEARLAALESALAGRRGDPAQTAALRGGAATVTP